MPYVKMYAASTGRLRKSLRVLTLLSVLCLASCKATQTILPTTFETRTTTRLRDTVITIAPDSATVRALLDCDSTNQVILRQLETRNGTRITATGTLLSPSFEGGVRGGLLSIVCHEDSLSRELQLRDSIITTLQTQTLVRDMVPQYYRNINAAFWVLLAFNLLFIAVKILLKIYFIR